MQSLTRHHRLRRNVYVSRVRNYRIPKQFLYCELAEGERPGSELRYKDCKLVRQPDWKNNSKDLASWNTWNRIVFSIKNANRDVHNRIWYNVSMASGILKYATHSPKYKCNNYCGRCSTLPHLSKRKLDSSSTKKLHTHCPYMRINQTISLHELSRRHHIFIYQAKEWKNTWVGDQTHGTSSRCLRPFSIR